MFRINAETVSQLFLVSFLFHEFFLLETIRQDRARGIDGKVDVPGPLIAVPKVYPAKADNKYGKLFPAKAAPSPCFPE